MDATRAKLKAWTAVATDRLLRPVDVASIVYFRLAFGAILFWEVWRYIEEDWIRRYYIDPSYHFTYYGFGWVSPMPGPLMYAFFGVMLLVTAAFALGYRYRLTSRLVFVGFGYWFLLDTARYLNHFYLIVLLTFVMMFTPAHQTLSMDAAAGRVNRSDFVPTWNLWLIRFQMGVVYVFGGIAKLGGDWLKGAPMADWLGGRTDFPIIGRFFEEEWMVRLFASGGLLLDLFIVPLLLWKRTRWPAFAVVIFFHASNDILWSIGVFPWMAIHASTIYFDADWPRKLLAKLGVNSGVRDDGVTQPKRLIAPGKAVVAVLVVFVLFNVGMPLRHHAYDGEVNWTDEGHRWSWRMKLRDKDASVEFWVTDPTRNETWAVDPDVQLTSWQENSMETRPDMIHQYAIHIADVIGKDRGHPVEVRAKVVASLHGRPEQDLIDPTVDIGSIPRGLGSRSWIVPLAHPLPDPFGHDNQTRS